MRVTSFIQLSFLAAILSISPLTFAAETQENPTDTHSPRPGLDATVPSPADNYTMDDAKITSTIKDRIDNSVTLKKFNIDVTTKEGVVTLKGIVDSDTQASNVVEIAQSLAGVKGINANDLAIKDSKQPFKDTLITAKVKGLFMREKVFGDKDIAAINISVETHDGIVYLSGHVDNQEQLDNAIKLAGTVEGVTKVEYKVKKLPTESDNASTSENTTEGTADSAKMTEGTTEPAATN